MRRPEVGGSDARAYVPYARMVWRIIRRNNILTFRFVVALWYSRLITVYVRFIWHRDQLNRIASLVVGGRWSFYIYE